MTVPIIVNCRDRLTPLLDLIAWLEQADDVGRVVLLDNDSTWPPLLEYYESTPHEVVRLGENLGHLAPWRSGIVGAIAGRYVVTDPDVVPQAPHDALPRLGAALDAYPGALKAGLSLRIDDLPADYQDRDRVLRWERQFWRRPLPGVYVAPVDTTFALYRQGAGPEPFPAVRLRPPYVARHMPWYATELQPEDEHYLARSRSSTWGVGGDQGASEPPRWGLRQRIGWLVRRKRHPVLAGRSKDGAAASEPSP